MTTKNLLDSNHHLWKFKPLTPSVCKDYIAMSENLDEENIIQFLTNDNKSQINHHLTDSDIIGTILAPEQNFNTASDAKVAVEKVSVCDRIS